MCRILLLALILLAGCQTVQGPFKPRSKESTDVRGLDLEEQASRTRDRYAIPDETRYLSQNSGNIFRGQR